MHADRHRVEAGQDPGRAGKRQKQQDDPEADDDGSFQS
jgi:hypothetical protein